MNIQRSRCIGPLVINLLVCERQRMNLRSSLLLVSLFGVGYGYLSWTVPTQSRHGQRQQSAIDTWQLFADTGNTDDVPKEGEEGEAEPSSPAPSGDILNSPAFLKRKLEVLQSDIAKVEADMEETKARVEAGKVEWGDQLEALQEEYKNIQDRFNSQSNEGDSIAIVQVSREILKVLDNYDRAFGAVKPNTDSEIAIEAEYKATYNDFMQTLSKIGVEEIVTVGTEFDYEVHQAVMQKPSEDFEEGIVCEEFQKGFKLGSTLIRAAMVAVAA